MAIAYIANALGGTTTTTSFSITLPATQANDILILEFTHRGTGNGTIGGTSVTTGGLTWALKHSQLYATSAFSGKTYWTRATGNHSGQTVTGSSLTNSCAAILTQYRGCVTTGDPLADATIVGEQNASANETQAQITTATNGAWVVLVVVNSPDLAVATQACTSPGTLTERAERLSTGGTDSSIAHASAEKATAGGTGAFTWTQTDAASGSWAYAIIPQALTNYTLACESGSYAVTGTAATPLYHRALQATTVAFAWTGTAATTLFNRLLSSVSGSLVWAGTDATFRTGITLPAESGAFAVTGTTASLLRGVRLAAASVALTWTGTATALLTVRVCACESGAYGWDGTDAKLSVQTGAAPLGVVSWRSRRNIWE